MLKKQIVEEKKKDWQTREDKIELISYSVIAGMKAVVVQELSHDQGFFFPGDSFRERQDRELKTGTILVNFNSLLHIYQRPWKCIAPSRT